MRRGSGNDKGCLSLFYLLTRREGLGGHSPLRPSTAGASKLFDKFRNLKI